MNNVSSFCYEQVYELRLNHIDARMTDHDLQKIQVTKLDAVRRQLETAVILWFQDGDPVSIHTLASAAYQVIYDLNRRRAGAPMMRDSPHVRPERLAEFQRILAQYENFFKHADRDPKKTVFFPPQITQGFILEAIEKYAEMAHERRPLFDVFVFYLAFTEPKIFRAEFTDKLRNIVPADFLCGIGKRQFFQRAFPMFTKIETG